jgi:predicted RNase H-like HicB family nuclease
MENNSALTARSRYTVVIQWDDVSRCYVVSFPEWGDLCHAYGNTYEEAARNAGEVLETLLANEASPPASKVFRYPGVELKDLPVPVVPPKDRTAVA